MTEALVKAAVVGTARQSEPHAVRRIRTAPALDAVVDEALTGTRGADADPRALLLRAGAWAVYRQAGYRGAPAPALPPAAPSDDAPECGPGLRGLLLGMIGGRDAALMPELLAQLEARGRRVPAALLPELLGTRDEALREALRPVLGARGRWLAGLNPAWAWAAGADAADLDEARAAFEEGALDERLMALASARKADPAQGRAWVETVWRTEKADVRERLLKAMGPGLGAEDEHFLEAALDDRARGVRRAAAALLTRLAGSALRRRMIARAEGMLARDAEGALTLTLPSDLPEAWERDGVRRQAPPEMGERAWWAGQVLARVPPGHWVECFQASPSALLAGLPPDEWVVVEAWVDGALRFGAPRWLEPLWLRLGATLDEDRGRAMTARRMRLLRAMPKAQAERLAREVLAGRAAYVEPSEVLQELPKPWSVAFGRAWIEHLGRHVKALDPHRVSWPDPWVETLRPAARALPVELAEAVSEALATLPTQGEWHIQRWLEARDALESTLLIRDTIHCEADADERREEPDP